jgi:hypothetical protein
MNYEFKEEENKKVYERCQTTIDGINSLIHILSEHNGVCNPDFQNVLKWFDILIKDAEDIKQGIVYKDKLFADMKSAMNLKPFEYIPYKEKEDHFMKNTISSIVMDDWDDED